MGVGTADTTHTNADVREGGVGGLDLADVDDATLVERCLAGDEAAWPWLVIRFQANDAPDRTGAPVSMSCVGS